MSNEDFPHVQNLIFLQDNPESSNTQTKSSKKMSKSENSNTSNNVGHLFGGPIFL